jgi:hypothetical protein
LNRIHIYFRKPPPGYKWIPGDKHILNFFRELFKWGKISGIEKVFINLCKGLDELQVDYCVNRPFKDIKPNEPVVILGSGKFALQGYKQTNPVVAGIGLMTHPAEWPGLFAEYPVAKYLQHSEWTRDIYTSYYGRDNCELWPAGIDTNFWDQDKGGPKKIDFLIYNKIMWDKEDTDAIIRTPILNALARGGFSYTEIIYGNYSTAEYFTLLKECKAMIFLCEHESQGFACCEALSMGVPVFAWDQGYWLDPNRFIWGSPVVKATSIPFFDERCGMSFKDIQEFENSFDAFWNKVKTKSFNPRAYILENITLKKSAQRMMDIIHSVYK